MRARAACGVGGFVALLVACGAPASPPLNPDGFSYDPASMGSPLPAAPITPVRARTLGNTRTATGQAVVQGQAVGTFRNTYYDFPRETDFKGDKAKLMNASCTLIAEVPKAFHDAVCVQGSGQLGRGSTVSFAKRDCACAEVCPRTGQKICFDELDKQKFPFGRGAAGTAIMPLVSVAADTQVLPLGTVIYVPEFDGIPVPGSTEPLDGCFVVQDRGSRVKGEHLDFFAGHPDQTKWLNERVPSNQGVTVMTDVARCERLRR
jgi:3D (Asp-Asp-Asp) domain-containing protein